MGNRVIARLEWLGGWDDVLIQPRAGYNDDRIAFDLMVEENGMVDVLCKATQDLDFYGFAPQEGCFFIKNYSEHQGLGEALVRAGVVTRTGRRVAFGPYDASADEYTFTPLYK